jgi:hypothetical protein
LETGETALPDNDYPLPGISWLSDKIVWLEQGISHSFSHEGADPRLDRKDPYLRLHFVSVYVHDTAAEVQSSSAREQFDDLTLIIAKKSG